jgi:hypothetical protein
MLDANRYSGDHAILNKPKHPFMVKIKSQLKKASD